MLVVAQPADEGGGDAPGDESGRDVGFRTGQVQFSLSTGQVQFSLSTGQVQFGVRTSQDQRFAEAGDSADRVCGQFGHCCPSGSRRLTRCCVSC